jgi:probable HAF family extracellular repeat protein
VGYYSGDGCSQTDCAFTHLKGKYTSVECALENQTAFFDISHTTAEVVGGYAYYGGVHGFIWQGVDSCFDIVDPDGTSNTQAEGVNDKGTVVGFYVGSSGAYQAFMYTAKGVYTTISCFGAASRAYGINDSDEIVGDYLDSDGVYRGFLYKSGKCSTVKYPKSRATYARGINKSGQITGFYGDGNNVAHGFLKTGSAFTTIDYPEAATTFLFHLNDSGAIAGFYQATAGGPTTGMVATPKK